MFEQLECYLDSKIAIGVIHYRTSLPPYMKEPMFKIVGVDERMWREVLKPEIQCLARIVSSDVVARNRTILQLPFVRVTVREKP